MVQLNTKRKPENIQDIEHSLLLSTQLTETQHNPLKKCNNCIWASAVQPVSKITERHRKY